MSAVSVFHLSGTDLREGTSLIEASAGTGKTYTIAGLFLRLILEQNLSVREILVVTYTVAATEELRHRIRQTLANALRVFTAQASDDPFLSALLKKHVGRENDLAARLRLALDGFDEAPIYTIHGFCQRVLKDRAFETGSLFDTELVTDQTPLLRQTIEDYWRWHFYRVGRLPVIFALKSGLSPERLLPLVRSNLSHPFLKLLSPVDGQDATELAAALEAVFNTLREVWRKEKDDIRGHFGSGAKWANKPYNDGEEMAEAFRQVEACLGASEFPPSALDALATFRGSAIAAKVSKKAKLPAPEHRFFSLCDELARAVEHYVIGIQLDVLRYVQQELPRRKHELKIQFYDDLLTRVHAALAGSEPQQARGHSCPQQGPDDSALREDSGASCPANVAADRNVRAPSGGGVALATALRRQYRAALIDEFQDTDPLQYDIFRRVFAGPENYSATVPVVGRASRRPKAPHDSVHGGERPKMAGETPAPLPEQPCHLFLIGDPKQAIYGFRGADIFTYLKASREAGHVYTLKENWRSESGLVRSVNTVFGVPALPFVFPGIRFQPVEAKGAADKQPLSVDGQRQPAFQLWFWRRTGAEINKGTAAEQLPPLVAAEIVRLLNGGASLGDRRLLPEDIAVLVPENRHAQLLQDALGRRNVPSVLYTSASLFESREVMEAQRVLAAVANPTHESQLKAALATDLMGYTGSRLEALATQEQVWQELLERFGDYLDLWTKKGVFQMFRSFMQHEQVRTRLLAFPDGERRLTNLLHLAEVLHRVSIENRLGVSGLLKWIAEQREVRGQASEDHQLRLETDEKAVKLVTIHKSKGLEYPVVFCPFSWRGADIEHGGEEQVFFHENGDGTLVRDLGSADYEAHKQLARVERLAEEVRKLYVALTRAKHRCYFVWGAFRGAATSAPAWLLHPLGEGSGAGVSPANEGRRDARPTTAEEHFAELDDDAMLADLGKLVEQSRDGGGDASIEVRELPQPSEQVFVPSAPARLTLDYRKFKGVIAHDWRISSFTSLTANQGEEQPDHDEAGAAARAEFPASGIFAFPAGAKPGTCLHKILEKLDFTQWGQPAAVELVREQLQVHGLPAAEFTEVVVEMLGKVMTAQLDEKVPDLMLGKLTRAQCLHELEFYFPLQRIAPQMIGKLLQVHRFFGGREPEGFLFAPVEGMLKGFIDLVFEFQGRFYLLDWKSNLLGSRLEDYGAAALAGEILRRHYYFQYQLYSVALDRYLRLRLPGYNYEQHFGGVYYLFLRGIDPSQSDCGIHRDRLPEPLLRALSRLLIGEAGEEDAADE